MTDSVAGRPPTWFWVVAVLGLLWCVIGVASYLMTALGAGGGFEAGMTEQQRALEASRPGWVMGAYAIAVFGGTVGCLGLLMRKRWAKLLLAISLIGVLAQQAWVFLLSDAVAVLGGSAAVLPIVVIVAAVALLWFAHHCEQRGWLS